MIFILFYRNFEGKDVTLIHTNGKIEVYRDLSEIKVDSRFNIREGAYIFGPTIRYCHDGTIGGSWFIVANSKDDIIKNIIKFWKRMYKVNKKIDKDVFFQILWDLYGEDSFVYRILDKIDLLNGTIYKKEIKILEAIYNKCKTNYQIDNIKKYRKAKNFISQILEDEYTHNLNY